MFKKKNTKKLSIRCSKEEKELMEKIAAKRGLDLDQCTIRLYKEAENKPNVNLAAFACAAQNVANYCIEHDLHEKEFFTRECEKIWDLLD